MERFDIHQQITNQIVAMMEEDTSEYRCPWLHSARGARPTNVASGNAYSGVNVLALWAAASLGGYTSGVWGTYRQWSALGAQVRKGEKAAYIVFWKQLAIAADEHDPATADEPSRARSSVARASAVFAAEQVAGYERQSAQLREPVNRLGRAESVIAATGAQICRGGERAYYRPSTDTIHMPTPDRFIGASTLSPTETYYATLLHEIVHWTGHPTRCARDISGRFGEQAYAMEELIAELGAAFLCADLSISPAPRPDHAHYLLSWLAVLRGDKRAIFAAATQASRAAAFVNVSEPVNRTYSPCLAGLSSVKK